MPAGNDQKLYVKLVLPVSLVTGITCLLGDAVGAAELVPHLENIVLSERNH